MSEGAGGRAFGESGQVFVDTGYLLALELRADQNHRPALEHWRLLLTNSSLLHSRVLLSTTYVLDETVTYLNARGLHASAVKVGKRLLASSSIELVRVNEDLFQGAFDLLERRPDKRYSLTDCVSFVLMRERGITTAFTFDEHFEQEGFVREPQER